MRNEFSTSVTNVPEITVVDAYHVHILTYISKFAGAVDFEQHFQSQGVRGR